MSTALSSPIAFSKAGEWLTPPVCCMDGDDGFTVFVIGIGFVCAWCDNVQPVEVHWWQAIYEDRWAA